MLRLFALAVGGQWATHFIVGGFSLNKVGVGAGAGFIVGLSILFGVRAFFLATVFGLLPMLLYFEPWRLAVAEEFVLPAGYALTLLIYRKLAGSATPLSSRQSVLAFVASAALGPAFSTFLLSGALEAALGASAIPPSPVPVVVQAWLRQVAGILAFAPVILAVLAVPFRAWVEDDNAAQQLPPRNPAPFLSRPQAIELVLETCLCALALWATTRFRVIYEANITYLAFVPLLWTAWRNGMMLGTLALATNTLTACALWWALNWVEIFPLVDFRLLILVSSLSTLAVGLTVDERKLATQALRHALAGLRNAEQQLRDIFDGALEGIYRTSAAGQCLTANFAMAGMLGYESPREAVSALNDAADQVWLDPAERVRLTELLARNGSVPDYVCRFQRKDGTPIWVSIKARASLDEDGRLLSYDAFVEDITERRRAEAERAQLELQFQQAQKMESVGRLAGGVAHDFNNMLTVIMGYAALLRLDIPTHSMQQKALSEIEKAGERARQLTQKLLGFSRQQVIAPVPSDLNELVQDLTEPLGRLIGEDIQLSFIPGKDLGTVLVDASQVNQILLNLVVNARDAMPSGGNLTIATENRHISEDYCQKNMEVRPGSFVVLSVTDTGVGIAPDVLPRIFEPFFTTKGTNQGTGLGLSMVYGIAKKNGGFVNAYSEPGNGSTFRVYFPRIAGEPATEAFPSVEGAELQGRGTVLVVEDDDLVRELVTSSLAGIGYTPIIAANAVEAIELCSSSVGSRICLVLSDVVMPGMNGMELRDRICAARPGMRVLFMSGYTSDVIVKNGILKPGVHFIQKPFTVGELSRRIEEVLA